MYEEQIIKLFENGMQSKDIAEQLNISRAWVSKILKKNNLSAKRNFTKEELIELHINQKLTIDQMCEKLNSHHLQIKKFLKKYNIERKYYRNKRKENFPSKEELIELHVENKESTINLKKKFNCSGTTIYNWMREYEIEPQGYISCLSKPQKEIYEFLSSKCENLLSNYKKLISPLEIDMCSFDKKIAIEFDGLHWHTEDKIERNYHLNKTKMCEKEGFQLIHIFEDEYNKNPELIKNILLAKLGIYEKTIQARKCKIEINRNDIKEFLDENHLQGKPHNIIFSISLLYEDEIIGCITYGKNHRNNYKDLKQIVLNRLCFKQGINIPGGSERLFKNSLQYLKEYDEIISWSDNRWSQGKVYLKMNFIKDIVSVPDYSYVLDGKRYSKQSKRKKYINCKEGQTEKERMIELGYKRIWDCGKIKWIYYLHK
jgi:very-short-patch-repair endonuclease/transposase/virulence-associated protein VapD